MTTPAAPRPAGAARLRLRISPVAETYVRGGHPWVFADSLRDENRPGQTGEIAVIYDRQDRFLAIGLFDAESPIRVRILHAGKPVNIDDDWWRARLRAALERRRGLFDDATTGHRWISGESDGWPGLVVDRYDTVLVLKIYSGVWLSRLDMIVACLRAELQPGAIVLRLSRNLAPTALAAIGRTDGEVVHGTLPDSRVIFRETGIAFEADVVRGQKTGFFLDQRENRRLVGSLADGAEVLNAFSFSGGFSLYAARGGARSVTDLDLSVHALDSAARNFALNQADPRIAACRHERVQADAFAWLEDSPRRAFDVVVLDPPSLAKREVERARAIAAYTRLAVAGVGRVRPGGLLVAASCSAHVSAAEFGQAVRETARRSGRRFGEERETAHPPDHPATFPEARYLKCLYLRFEPGTRG